MNFWVLSAGPHGVIKEWDSVTRWPSLTTPYNFPTQRKLIGVLGSLHALYHSGPAKSISRSSTQGAVPQTGRKGQMTA